MICFNVFECLDVGKREEKVFNIKVDFPSCFDRNVGMCGMF